MSNSRDCDTYTIHRRAQRECQVASSKGSTKFEKQLFMLRSRFKMQFRARGLVQQSTRKRLQRGYHQWWLSGPGIAICIVCKNDFVLEKRVPIGERFRRATSVLKFEPRGRKQHVETSVLTTLRPHDETTLLPHDANTIFDNIWHLELQPFSPGTSRCTAKPWEVDHKVLPIYNSGRRSFPEATVEESEHFMVRADGKSS